MRSICVVLAIAAALAVAPSVASAKFHYTHRISVSGQLTDHWSTTDPASCGTVGDGSVTVDFHTATTVRVRPYISRSSQPLHARQGGRWILGVPVGGGIGDLAARPVTGTAVTVDNTVKGPNTANPSDTCVPDDKSGCGVLQMKKAHVGVEGYDRRSLLVDLILGAGSEFWQNNLNGTFKGFCRTGSLAGWMDPATTVGGTPLYGELLVKMPSRSSLKHKHTVSVTGTTHMVSTSSPSVHSTEVDTDDVTRTVTVTFTRL